MMLKISKDFKWEMGHRLMHHKGLCANPHGHSYKMRVVLEGEMTDNMGMGMVIDYYDLDKIVWEVLEDFNHSFVVNENDLVVKDFLTKNDFKSVILPFEPTAENLCSVFENIIKNKLKNYKNIKTLTIRLYETCDVYAEHSITL